MNAYAALAGVPVAEDNIARITTVHHKQGDIVGVTDNATIKTVGKNSLEVISKMVTAPFSIVINPGRTMNAVGLLKLSFSFFGGKTGTITVDLTAPDARNAFRTTFVDNWIDWKTVSLPLSQFRVLIGKPNWGNLRTLSFGFPRATHVLIDHIGFSPPAVVVPPKPIASTHDGLIAGVVVAAAVAATAIGQRGARRY